jgi:hypothetical protein
MDEKEHQGEAGPDRESLSFLFVIDIGPGLAYLLKPPEEGHGAGPHFVSAVYRVREVLIKEWGVKLPPFLIRENRSLPQGAYRFSLFNREIVTRSIPPGKTMIISGAGKAGGSSGPGSFDPIYSLPCVWVETDELGRYSRKESYSASTGEVILEHLEAVLRSNAAQFITSEAVKERLELLRRVEPELVRETLEKLTFTGLVSLMKNLVPEGIPFTELEGVIRTLASREFADTDPDLAGESLRQILKNNLHSFLFRDSLMLFVTLDWPVQLYLYARAGEDRQMPDRDPVASAIVKELAGMHLYFQSKSFRLGVICCSPVRLIVRRLLERNLPGIAVLKPEEMEPSREIMIIKKIRNRSLKATLTWAWFWLSAPPGKRREFKRAMDLMKTFLKKIKESSSLPSLPGPLGTTMPGKTQKLPPPPMPGRNLPAPPMITARQKAAMHLTRSSDDYVKSVFALLGRREYMSLAAEMANLPGGEANIDDYVIKNVLGEPLNWSNPSSMMAFVKKAFPVGEDRIKLPALQKIAVILSSLPPRLAEKMYHLILSGISSEDLEGLTLNISRKQLFTLHEIRRWVVDDFLWFVKGSYQPGVLYSSAHWMGELQRIANNSPHKLSLTLRELWLEQGSLQQRFDLFVRENPPHAARWIRQYVTSKQESDTNLLLPEKAYILIHLLPGELSAQIMKRLGKSWRRIFSLLPRPATGFNPEEAGLVITQFLSHYYSTYEKGRLSGISMQ